MVIWYDKEGSHFLSVRDKVYEVANRYRVALRHGMGDAPNMRLQADSGFRRRVSG